MQNVQADLTNLGVELKKFRNMNKMYKRVLHRQHELNQRMRWRLFETDQENETLRQLVKTLRASRVSARGVKVKIRVRVSVRVRIRVRFEVKVGLG